MGGTNYCTVAAGSCQAIAAHNPTTRLATLPWRTRTHCTSGAPKQRLQRTALQPLHKDKRAAGFEHTAHLHGMRGGADKQLDLAQLKGEVMWMAWMASKKYSSVATCSDCKPGMSSSPASPLILLCL